MIEFVIAELKYTNTLRLEFENHVYDKGHCHEEYVDRNFDHLDFLLLE
jgi:hypothetical protein